MPLDSYPVLDAPQPTVYQCPVCQLALQQEATRYVCGNDHSFDIAREGYVNLLLPHHTGRGKPGDTQPMLQSRRAFLEQGYYQQFSDQLNEVVAREIGRDRPADVNILDAGCGEGYYTWRLRDALAIRLPETPVQLYGIDVARPGVRTAAKHGHGIRFAVASTFHLPFMPGSLDGIVCVFAPRDEAEFSRVLTAQGMLIVAAPGPRHLFQLRELFYQQPELLGEKGTVTAGFHLTACVPVTYTIHLTSTEDLLHLVNMTPYSRHIDAATLERLQTFDEYETEVDFNIMVYRVEGK